MAQRRLAGVQVAALAADGFEQVEVTVPVRALRFVRAFERDRKPIAVICHGPEVLISAGLVKGRRIASWPGIADDVRNAGGIWEDEKLVCDCKWVSSRAPYDLAAFKEGMIDLFDERASRGLAPAPRRFRWVATLIRGLAVVAWRAGRRLLAARA